MAFNTLKVAWLVLCKFGDVVYMQIYANLKYANIISKDAIMQSREDVQANTLFDEIEHFF